METKLEAPRAGAALLEDLCRIVERYGGAKEMRRAEDALTRLARGLRERIRMEEAVLFPALERLVKDEAFVPTRRLRRQHTVLLELLAGIERSIQREEWGAVVGDLQELRAALNAHLEHERGVLMPIAGTAEAGRA
jgi:iron-sulfur cluster repair protein YtfE (RIC family)